MSNILRSEAADLSLSNLGGHEWVPPTSLKTWRLFSQIYKIPDSEFQELLSGKSGSLTGGIESGQHHWGIILGKDGNGASPSKTTHVYERSEETTIQSRS